VLRIALKGLLARKLRLVTTSLAVLLGVAFMSGTLVLTDTIGRTFDQLFADASAGTDAVVRAKAVITGDFSSQRDRIPATLLATVRGVPGVKDAEGQVEGYTQVVGRDGKAVGNPGRGAPTFGRNWSEVAALNPFRIIDGHAPQAPDEVVLDRYTATTAGWHVGDTFTVLVEKGPQRVRLAGIAKFGSADGTGGATQVMYAPATAQRLVGTPGTYDSIAVVGANGVSQPDLRDRITAALPPTAEAITGKALVEENQSTLRKSLRFFDAFLFTFAVVALLVGSFMIYNTFSIVVAQRGRESALLRALGASRRQVLGTVLVEALVVGLLAALLGMVGGVGIAAGLKALLSAFGIDIPAGGVVFTLRTAIVALVTGVGVTLASAFFPARRAAKVPPLAALRDLAVEPRGSSRRRTITGGLVTAIGVALLMSGLFSHTANKMASVGFGATVVFFGVAILGPTFARPVSGLIGAPLPRLRGVAGTLARENAMRSPKRTASTAAALMIGVGLVGFITIFAASAKSSVSATIDKAFTGDFVVASGTFGFGGLSPSLATSLRTLPEVRAVSGLRIGQAKVEGHPELVGAVDVGPFSQILDLDIASGDFASMHGDEIAVDTGTARSNGWHVGDSIKATFAKTGERTLRIAAIYRRSDVGGRYLLPIETYDANFAQHFDAQVFVAKSPGVDAAAARRAVESVTKAYPNATLQDQTEFKKSQAAQIDTLLNLIYVLLVFAIGIAVLGIMNTLALSIFERTRELGLLRAVGMTRRQLRSAVRWESVIIALFGTGLGLLIGLFFGWALVQALRSYGFSKLTIPVGSLAVVVVLAALAGVLAAVLPGRRAARLDVLQAISAT
jgi:putative ABC transport system permease protein